ncbi:MAG: hypothetical protein AAF515_05065 [Pseudomonadota bacterium]
MEQTAGVPQEKGEKMITCTVIRPVMCGGKARKVGEVLSLKEAEFRGFWRANQMAEGELSEDEAGERFAALNPVNNAVDGDTGIQSAADTPGGANRRGGAALSGAETPDETPEKGGDPAGKGGAKSGGAAKGK